MSKKKRCLYCKSWYVPYARQGKRQKTCGEAACRRKHKRALDRAWRAADPGWSVDRRCKVRDWAGSTGYWRQWRRGNPKYQAREARRMRRNRAGSVAKQDLLNRDPVGYLKGVRDLKALGVAKQDLLGLRFDEVLDYLIERERVAKQEGADGLRCGVV